MPTKPVHRATTKGIAVKRPKFRPRKPGIVAGMEAFQIALSALASGTNNAKSPQVKLKPADAKAHPDTLACPEAKALDNAEAFPDPEPTPRSPGKGRAKRPPDGEPPSRPIGLLPETGFVRLPTILQVWPVSRASFLAGVKDGKYPPGVLLSPRVRAWPVEDIRRLLEEASKAV